MASNNTKSSNFRFLILSIVAIYHLNSFCFADFAATFNINTFLARPLVAPPLTYKLSAFDPVTLENNGKGIDTYLNQATKRNFVFGGPLPPGSVYYGYNVRFNFNASIFGTSGLTFNNFGTPITVDSFLFNGKYASAAAASLFPDGILIIRTPVRIGVPSPLFPAFQTILRLIENDGSRTEALNAFVIGWFTPTLFVGRYFSYQGLYASSISDVPIKYNTATVIAIPLESTNSISAAQAIFILRGTLLSGTIIPGKYLSVIQANTNSSFLCNGPSSDWSNRMKTLIQNVVTPFQITGWKKVLFTAGRIF